VNVTQAHIYFRSDTNANLTSANTPLGNASLNAGEAVFVTDQKRVRVGIGNYTTLDSLANLTDISTLNTTVSGKSDIGHVHVIANVTGLQTALDGKSATTHVHDATTDITSGTVPPARLPIANATSLGVVKAGANITIDVNGTISANGTGGGGGGYDPGFIFDVRDADFADGVAVGPSNSRQNTLAIQAAVDAAAVQTGGNGGGTVFLPGTERQNDTMIDLESPIWMNCDNTRITGFSKESTVVRSQGPCFVWAKNPRYWDIERKILTDKTTGTKYLARQYENALKNSELASANPTLESGQVVYIRHESNGSLTGEYKTGPGAYNSLSMSTGATVFPTPEMSYFSRYKIDLREFRTSGGAFPPTNGNPEFAPVAGLSTGQHFALRGWSGAVKGDYWFHPIANGDITQATQSATRWPHHSVITWQCVIQHITAVWWGGIMGVGSENDPDPFILFGAGSSTPTPPTRSPAVAAPWFTRRARSPSATTTTSTRASASRGIRCRSGCSAAASGSTPST
jgi:hypothetical protein